MTPPTSPKTYPFSPAPGIEENHMIDRHFIAMIVGDGLGDGDDLDPVFYDAKPALRGALPDYQVELAEGRVTVSDGIDAITLPIG